MNRALTAVQNMSAWLTQYREVFWGPGWSELPDHYSMLTNGSQYSHRRHQYIMYNALADVTRCT